MRDELRNFTNYRLTCKKAEGNNHDKICLLWAYKKLFSVPWIVAYDHLLV